jgi:ketosteroid isomerase-like protein
LLTHGNCGLNRHLWAKRVAGQVVSHAHSKTQNMSTAITSDEKAAIRELEDRFVVAFNSGDIDAIMKNYVPDESFILLDVVPRKEYRGAHTYREAWVDMFSQFRGLPKIAIEELGITVDGSVGFGYSFQRVTGINKDGEAVNRLVRVTDGYRKIDGNWLIALEHISVPVDFRTGRAVETIK